MINKIPLDAIKKMTFPLRTFVALGMSTVFVLSVFHHTLNFWGLTWLKQLLIVALIPVLALPINYFVTFMWERGASIPLKRWLLFVLPVLAITSFLTWRVFESPLVWHSIEITFKENSGRSQAQLVEIRDSYGAVVSFSKIQDLGDWAVQEGILTAVGSGSQQIHYAFFGPFRRPVELRFLTSPESGDVEINVDGKTLDASLFDQENGQRVIKIDPRYRFLIPRFVFMPFVIAIDFLAFLCLLTILWLIQEIHQTTQPPIQSEDEFSRQRYWKGLGILLVLSFVMHAVNFLSVPLAFGSDSPGYMDGAVHWAKYHNLEGASPIRGPGMSILFLPAIVLFERNPWAIKFLLHLFAFASVPLSYHLGWQLSRKYPFAFLAGLLTALTPDLFLHANYVMSEVPTIFFVLLCCVLLLKAFETMSSRWILLTVLIGSFTVLIRTESLLFLVLAVLFLLVHAWKQSAIREQSRSLKKLFDAMKAPVKRVGLSIALAALPLVAWSAHNYQQHGFFGLSNYAAAVFYDGWIYDGEASHIPVTDQSSPAFQIIKKVYWDDPSIARQPHVPTSLTIHDYMVEHGFSSQEVFSLLNQVTIDSITNDYRTTWRVLVVKLHDSFEPEPYVLNTFPLPRERSELDPTRFTYVDDENFVIPPLVLFHRKLYDLLSWYYELVYLPWAWFCVGAMLLCLYRKPVIPWLPVALITIFRVGFANLYGFSNWRFVLPGWPLMQILGLAVLQSIYLFFRLMLHSHSTNEPVPAAKEHQRIS